MLVGKLELNPKASWQSGSGLCLIRLRNFFKNNHRTIPLWLVWLKILNTQNLHFLPLRRRGIFPSLSKGSRLTPFPNLGGAKPCSKVVSRAASWNYTFPLKRLKTLKTFEKLIYRVEDFFVTEACYPVGGPGESWSLVGIPTVGFDASYIM